MFLVYHLINKGFTHFLASLLVLDFLFMVQKNTVIMIIDKTKLNLPWCDIMCPTKDMFLILIHISVGVIPLYSALYLGPSEDVTLVKVWPK